MVMLLNCMVQQQNCDNQLTSDTPGMNSCIQQPEKIAPTGRSVVCTYACTGRRRRCPRVCILFEIPPFFFPVTSLLRCTVLYCPLLSSTVSTQGWQPGRIVELHLPQLAALGPMGEGGRGGLMPRESKLREVVAHNKWNNGIVQLSGLRFGHTEGKEASASKISRAEDQSAADASAISNPATEEASPAAPAVPTPLHSRGGGGGGGGPRHLQDETCELATDFTLSNTGYSAVTGCYSVISATEPYIFVPVAFDGLIMRSTYLTSEYGVSVVVTRSP